MVIHDDCLHAWYFHSELVDRCRDPRNPIISNPIQFQYDWGVTNSPCYWHLQSFTCYPKRIWLTWSPRLWITWKTDATFMRFFGALKDWDEDFDLVPRTNKYPRNWWWENLQKTLYLAKTIVTHRISLKPMAMYTAQECASGKLSLCSVARARKCWEET